MAYFFFGGAGGRGVVRQWKPVVSWSCGLSGAHGIYTRRGQSPTPHARALPWVDKYKATLSARHRAMSRAVPSGRREGMFPGRYSEIFGLGERLGCILNLGHSFDAIEAYFRIC